VIYSFLRNLQLLRGLRLLLFQEVFCGLSAFEAWTLRLRLTGQRKQSLLRGSCLESDLMDERLQVLISASFNIKNPSERYQLAHLLVQIVRQQLGPFMQKGKAHS